MKKKSTQSFKKININVYQATDWLKGQMKVDSFDGFTDFVVCKKKYSYNVSVCCDLYNLWMLSHWKNAPL